jgi:hypothetical protein
MTTSIRAFDAMMDAVRGNGDYSFDSESPQQPPLHPSGHSARLRTSLPSLAELADTNSVAIVGNEDLVSEVAAPTSASFLFFSSALNVMFSFARRKSRSRVGVQVARAFVQRQESMTSGRSSSAERASSYATPFTYGTPSSGKGGGNSSGGFSASGSGASGGPPPLPMPSSSRRGSVADGSVAWLEARVAYLEGVRADLARQLEHGARASWSVRSRRGGGGRAGDGFPV